MMSDPGEPQSEEMQFDRAEYADNDASGPVCGACHHEIKDEYYEANGVLLCGPCRQAVHNAIAGGSRLARFLRASVFGLVAAVAGFAIYFGIMKTTGLEIGLISILVGAMVGIAVRKGSNNRGGWVYQLLAMFLVYTAIVASYGATIFPAMIAKHKEENAAKEADMKDPGPGGVNNPGQAAAPVGGAAAEKPNPFKNAGLGKILGQLALAILVLLGFLYALPVLAGFQSPMGLVIIAFALWEAWKINRKVSIVFNGPYWVASDDNGGAA